MRMCDYYDINSSLQQFEKLGWMRKAERGRKMTKSGRLFLDEFSGRITRSPMVTTYWKRRHKQEKYKRQLERKKRAQKAAKAGKGKKTAGGDEQYTEQQEQDQFQTAGGDNVVDETVEEYE